MSVIRNNNKSDNGSANKQYRTLPIPVGRSFYRESNGETILRDVEMRDVEPSNDLDQLIGTSIEHDSVVKRTVVFDSNVSGSEGSPCLNCGS